MATGVRLGLILAVILSFGSCTLILLNPYEADTYSNDDVVQPGTLTAGAFVLLAVPACLVYVVWRRRRRGVDDPAACREDFNHAGRVAAAIFSVFFTLFTQWSFAWVEAKPVIWMLVWFAGAYGTTRLAAWAAVRIACAPDGALPPTGSDDT